MSGIAESSCAARRSSYSPWHMRGPHWLRACQVITASIKQALSWCSDAAEQIMVSLSLALHSAQTVDPYFGEISRWLIYRYEYFKHISVDRDDAYYCRSARPRSPVPTDVLRAVTAAPPSRAPGPPSTLRQTTTWPTLLAIQRVAFLRCPRCSHGAGAVMDLSRVTPRRGTPLARDGLGSPSSCSAVRPWGRFVTSGCRPQRAGGSVFMTAPRCTDVPMTVTGSADGASALILPPSLTTSAWSTAARYMTVTPSADE